MHLGRIEFNIVLFTDWSFASGCSPPRLSTTQLPSATDRPVLLSDRDFHPTIGAYFQAHSSSPFGAKALRASGWTPMLPWFPNYRALSEPSRAKKMANA